MPKASKINKGMILCAGLGTRLLPITERFPKPLVPVLNIPNMLHNVALLQRHGIREIVINLFHLPDRIEEFLKEHEYTNFRIFCSREPVLLGTGGGVKHAEPFFEGQSLVLANCDFITNANLNPVIATHLETESWASMVLLDDPERQKLYSSVGVDAQGRLCSLPRKQTKTPARSGIFTGIHVLSPEIFQFLEEKPCGINEILYPHLMDKHPDKTHGYFLEKSFWYDTGDIPAIWAASMKLLDLLQDKKSCLMDVINTFGARYQEVKNGVWVSDRAVLPSYLKVQGPVMIGEACSFAEGVELGPYAVLGNGVSVQKNSKIDHSVVLSHSTIEANQNVSGKIFYEGQSLPAKPLT